MMKTKRGFFAVGFLSIGFSIVVKVSLAQTWPPVPPMPPLPPGYEEWLGNNNFSSFSFPELPGGGEGGESEPQYNPPPYDFEGLGLMVPLVLTNQELQLTLFDHGTNATYGFTNFPYHIYGRSKFNFHYRWRELSVGAVGQTNFFVPNPAPSNMFYIALLGTHSDTDGLIDGLEALLGTDPENDDTDGDGLSDFLEWRMGSNPLNAAGIVADTNGLVNLRVHTRLK